MFFEHELHKLHEFILLTRIRVIRDIRVRFPCNHRFCTVIRIIRDIRVRNKSFSVSFASDYVQQDVGLHSDRAPGS